MSTKFFSTAPSSFPTHVGISLGRSSIVNIVQRDNNLWTRDSVRIERIADLYNRKDGGGIVQVGIPINLVDGFRRNNI
jgi:hypothetical protein